MATHDDVKDLANHRAGPYFYFSGPALAQPDTRRGLSLAREHCAQCHAIGNASESPLAAAPPFRELHLKYAVSDF